MAVEERIKRIERQNRWLKVGFGLMLLIVVAGGWYFMVFDRQGVTSATQNESSFSGVWRATITEPTGDIITVTISLLQEEKKISGTARIKSDTGLPDEARNMLRAAGLSPNYFESLMPLELIHFNDGQLSFVIPIFPPDPGECIFMKIEHDNGKLKGISSEVDGGHEQEIEFVMVQNKSS